MTFGQVYFPANCSNICLWQAGLLETGNPTTDQLDPSAAMHEHQEAQTSSKHNGGGHSQKGFDMTPKRPIELVNASVACSEAWAKRDEMIEANDAVGIMAMNSACGILDYHYNTLYQEWQILGGTSDIRSIALCGIGEIPDPAQLPQSTNARDPFPQDAELGSRCIISGGEVIELDDPHNYDSDYASWNEDPY